MAVAYTVVHGKNMVAKNTLKESKVRKRQCSLVFDSVISRAGRAELDIVVES